MYVKEFELIHKYCVYMLNSNSSPTILILFEHINILALKSYQDQTFAKLNQTFIN